MQRTSDSLINYTSSRSLFKKAAVKAGLQLKEFPIEGQGIHGEPLFQDIAFADFSAATTLVHLSGVHGVEGYLGSLIQQQILNQFSTDKKINCLFVHAVNPFGMSWYRRVNKNNIDLNRNGISDIPPLNKDFFRFAKLLSCESKLEIFAQIPQVLWQVSQIGMKRSTQSIAGGQWSEEKSLFYGGQSVEPELEKLAEAFALTPSANKFVVIDVHTGLGRCAYDSLYVANNDHGQREFFRKLAEASHVIDTSSGTDLYKTSCTIEDFLIHKFPNKQISYITQEFGTLHFISVLTSLILENSIFHQTTKFSQNRQQLLLQSFFPEHKKQWKERCLQTGVSRYNELSKLLTTV